MTEAVAKTETVAVTGDEVCARGPLSSTRGGSEVRVLCLNDVCEGFLDEESGGSDGGGWALILISVD